MTDVLEIGLEDSQLLDEIALVTELIIAASSSPGPLDQRHIDALLGVQSQHDPAAPESRRISG